MRVPGTLWRLLQFKTNSTVVTYNAAFCQFARSHGCIFDQLRFKHPRTLLLCSLNTQPRARIKCSSSQAASCSPTVFRWRGRGRRWETLLSGFKSQQKTISPMNHPLTFATFAKPLQRYSHPPLGRACTSEYMRPRNSKRHCTMLREEEVLGQQQA